MAPRATVWLADSCAQAGSLADYRGWLSPSEARRYAGFTRAQRRLQFLVGRGLLRRALAEVCDCPTAAIVLDERPGQAPGLLSPQAGEVGFSLSHSGRWVACAVSEGARLGLDIEVRDPSRDIGALAAQAFAPAQQAWLAARPAEVRVDAFYRMWAGQEALIKLDAACAQAFELEHPVLAVVLCSARALDGPPALLEMQC